MRLPLREKLAYGLADTANNLIFAMTASFLLYCYTEVFGLTAAAAARRQFEKELQENLAQLHNHPSITTWVLFNEGWGEYDQDRLERCMVEWDGSRLLNGHSGAIMVVNGNRLDEAGSIGTMSQLADVHSYPDPAIFRSKALSKASVLGEYGGISVLVKDHVWINPNVKDWPYEDSAPEGLPRRYRGMLKSLRKLEGAGLTASIYTQPFDVETERNGLMTYDREIMKIPPEEIQRMNADFLKDVELKGRW